MSISVLGITLLLLTILYIAYDIVKSYLKGSFKAGISFMVNILNVLISLLTAPKLTELIFGNTDFAEKLTQTLMEINTDLVSIFFNTELKTMINILEVAIRIPFVFVMTYWTLRIIFAIILFVVDKKVTFVFKFKLKENTDKIIGAVIGTVSALVFGAVSIMPIYNLGALESDYLKDDLTKQLVQEKYGAIIELKNSPANKIYQYTFTQNIGTAVFDKLTVVEINGNKMFLNEAVTELSNLSDSVDRIYDSIQGKRSLSDIVADVELFAEILSRTAIISEEYKTETTNKFLNTTAQAKGFGEKFINLTFDYKTFDEFKQDIKTIRSITVTIDQVQTKIANKERVNIFAVIKTLSESLSSLNFKIDINLMDLFN